MNPAFNLDEIKLAEILRRYQHLQNQLTKTNPASREYADLGREYGELTPLSEAIMRRQQLVRECQDLQILLDQKEQDAEIYALAQSEYGQTSRILATMEQQITNYLLPRETNIAKNVILEIRAGSGGEEAALFASDLSRMYLRYGELQGWRIDILSHHLSDLGGMREFIAHIKGANAYEKLQFESGIHRVQRVPVTEAGGRIHTSAASVAILPEIQEIDIVIRDEDLRIDVYRSSAPGGQHVNRTESAVRITHLPSGLVVCQQDEKSQHRNRDKAMRILRARLHDHERNRQESERAGDRRRQIGSGDRSQRIRTYNYPRATVKDHRIKKSWSRLERIIAGDELDMVIIALSADQQMRRMALTTGNGLGGLGDLDGLDGLGEENHG